MNPFLAKDIEHSFRDYYVSAEKGHHTLNMRKSSHG